MSSHDEVPDFDGRYVNVRRLAERPRAILLAAEHAETGEPRFLKWASDETMAHPSVLHVFLHEPAVLRRLERDAGPQVVIPVVDEGEANGRPYFAQPLLSGHSLADAMQGTLLPPEAVVGLIERCLVLLHAIHGAGVIHADISPENIFIRADEPMSSADRPPAAWHVWFTDFETAMRLDGRENKLSAVVGKVPYMGPECLEGKPLTVATDIFALGVVFYELLAGDRPHKRKRLEDVLLHAAKAIPPLPLSLGVPMPVEELVVKMLAPRPEERPASAAEALMALRHATDIHRWLTSPAPAVPYRPRAPQRQQPASTSVARARTSTYWPGAQPSLSAAPGPAEQTVLPAYEPVPVGSAVEEPDESLYPKLSAAGGGGGGNGSAIGRVDDPATNVGAPEIPGFMYLAPESAALLGAAGKPPAPVPPAVAPAAPRTAPEIPPPRYDDDVQFTVYRPRVVKPEVWYPLLAFAHLSERPADAPDDEPDPVEEVNRQARQVLGERAAEYRQVVQDSGQPIPREGELTFRPEIPGFTFNPPSRSFLWQESVHREEFRLRADGTLDGTTAVGRMSVFWGAILVADVALRIKVDRNHVTAAARESPARADARPYRNIFASYSHLDLDIVRHVEQYVKMMGDQYLRDWTHLRAGEEWSDALMRLIDQADVFQLFWSRNSMISDFVRQEWEYALALRRPNFIRPSFWEEPMPRSDDPLLPPAELGKLHFQRIALPSARTASVGFDLPPVAAEEEGLFDTIHPGGLDQLKAQLAEQRPGPVGGREGEATKGVHPTPSANGHLVGPYEIVKSLGRGGMGTIGRARHRITGLEVVIKELVAESYGKALFDEAPNVGRLQHPQIIRLLDALEHEGKRYLVRDYVEAEPLRARGAGSPTSVRHAVDLILSLAGALEYVQERGFRCRDLKTSGILVNAQGQPLMPADDFVALHGPFQEFLMHNGVCGTPAYMGPERFDPAPLLDARSDMYALGVILFELLTGRLPFEASELGGFAGLFDAICTRPAPGPRAYRPEVPEALDALCLRCLAKSPADRFASAAELAAELRSVAAGLPAP